MPNILDTLKERIVVFDGAMGTNLQVQNLTLDDFGGPRFEGCNENLLVTRPDAVEKVHTGFLDVGCDVIETNSFNGTPVDFAEYGVADKAYEMNVLAARLAKRVASDYATKDKPRWVAGSMGPGPKHMTESIRYICENTPLPVSVLPNAGLPSVLEGKMHYDETPESFTAQLVHFAGDFGANIVGGCCGTTPAHLKLVVEAMQRITPKQRGAKTTPAASSIYSQQPYLQDASFLIVGERVNASGSKKMRDLPNAEDW